MKIELWVIGKTNFAYLKEGEGEFLKRLKHYAKFEYVLIPDVKNAGKLGKEELKREEGKILLKRIKNDDLIVLLDEKGKEYNSKEFADSLEKKQMRGLKKVIFIIGGAFGFSPEMYERADEKMALSKLTFSHQMVRVFFLEQLYRAFTILKGEKYHH